VNWATGEPLPAPRERAMSVGTGRRVGAIDTDDGEPAHRGVGGVVLFEWCGGHLVVDPDGSKASRSVLEARNDDRATVRILERHLRPGMTFVAVGARVGFSTLLGARLVGPRGQVVAIEPCPGDCRLLLLTIFHNESANVTVWPVALTDHQGWACLSAEGLTTGSAEDLIAGAPVVPTFPLDQLLQGPIDVLRLDAAGAEALVIRGARRLLGARRPAMVMALCPASLRRISGVSVLDHLRQLAALGYRLGQVDASSGQVQPIRDLPAYAASFTDPRRREQLLLLPY